MRAALLLIFLLPGAAFCEHDMESCPDGTYRVATDNPLEPFHCKSELRTDQPYITLTPTYKLRPCPKGRHPVETPGLGAERRYRCAPDRRKPAEPAAAPLLPAAPLASARRAKAAVGFAPPSQYVKVTEQGAFQVEVPKDWRATDGWDDDTPGYYLEFDTGRQGRQVQLVLSKVARGQEDYVSLEDAVARAKERQNAAEDQPGRAAGFPARFTFVKGSSRTAYISIEDQAYFVLTYSAPEDLYEVYEPVFARMLATLRIAKDQRR